MSSPMPSAVVVAPPVSVLPVSPGATVTMTFAQLQEILKSAASPQAAAETVGADALAAIKKILADAEGAASGVHGAAKALQADVKSNVPLVVVGLAAFTGLSLQVLHLFHVIY